MSPEDLDISNEELLVKFHLMSDGKLKRSAVMLFYSDPSVIQNGSYVKIGRFTNAIIHNCYMFGTPIQIRVENEAIIISNQCFSQKGGLLKRL